MSLPAAIADAHDRLRQIGLLRRETGAADLAAVTAEAAEAAAMGWGFSPGFALVRRCHPTIALASAGYENAWTAEEIAALPDLVRGRIVELCFGEFRPEAVAVEGVRQRGDAWRFTLALHLGGQRFARAFTAGGGKYDADVLETVHGFLGEAMLAAALPGTLVELADGANPVLGEAPTLLAYAAPAACEAARRAGMLHFRPPLGEWQRTAATA